MNVSSIVRRALFTRMLPALALALTAFLTGCSFTTRQSTLDPKGPVAQVQYDVFMITVWVTLGIFIVVGGILVWVVWKFRERPGDENKPLPEQGHGNPLIEISLIGVSVLLLVVIAVPTLEAIWFTHEMPSDTKASQLGTWYPGEVAPEEKNNVLEITVYGYQWWWAFDYPQFGIRTANELVIPTGKIVKLNLRSQDVIHSFWLPKIAGKVDLIPGRRNWMWIQADEEGHYYGQCAEFCGEAHAYMLFRADAVSDEAFAEWVEANRNGAEPPAGESWNEWFKVATSDPVKLDGDPVQLGARLFMTQAQCIQCHRIGNSPANSDIGPDLTLVGRRKSLGAGLLDNRNADGEIDEALLQENLYQWIRYSHNIKPGNLMYYGTGAFQEIKRNLEERGTPLTEEDFRNMAIYLSTLK